MARHDIAFRLELCKRAFDGNAGRLATAPPRWRALRNRRWQSLRWPGRPRSRIAHLLGEDLPIRRPPARLVALSLLGAIAAVWLVMCLSQGALAAIGV